MIVSYILFFILNNRNACQGLINHMVAAACILQLNRQPSLSQYTDKKINKKLKRTNEYDRYNYF